MSLSRSRPDVRVPSDTQLDDWGPAVEPIGTPVAMIRGRSHFRFRNIFDFGSWQCTPGRWRRQVKTAELAYFTAGYGWFYPDGGEGVEIRPGKTVLFPPLTTGTWDLTETVSKKYLNFRMVSVRALHGRVLELRFLPWRPTAKPTRVSQTGED